MTSRFRDRDIQSLNWSGAKPHPVAKRPRASARSALAIYFVSELAYGAFSPAVRESDWSIFFSLKYTLQVESWDRTIVCIMCFMMFLFNADFYDDVLCICFMSICFIALLC